MTKKGKKIFLKALQLLNFPVPSAEGLSGWSAVIRNLESQNYVGWKRRLR